MIMVGKWLDNIERCIDTKIPCVVKNTLECMGYQIPCSRNLCESCKEQLHTKIAEIRKEVMIDERK